MSRIPLLIFFLALLGSFSLTLHAITDEEKKKLFLKAREEIRTVSEEPAPKRKTTSKPKAKKKTVKKPAPKPKLEDAPEPDKPEKNEKSAIPEKIEKTETPERQPAAIPTPSPTPISQHQPAVPAAPITVQKSGLEQESGYEPPPPPPERRFWFFGGPKYRYLTRSVRAEIDRPKVKKHLWRYIVVHNSGTKQGNAKVFEYYHRYTRKMPNGLAYHFVIGNGSSSGDGEIEIGNRWARQINGGHVHSDYLNSIAIGICLVGDFNRSTPTKAQMESLEELVRYLRKRVGKTDGKVAVVKPHRDINPPRWPTDCPGDRFPFSWLEKEFD